MKWKTLEHNGILFPPEYEYKKLEIKIKNKKIKLNELQEEMAWAWAAKRNTPYIEDKIFIENFLNDFKKILPKEQFGGVDIKDIDFSNPLNLKAYQYDIVCNGIELSSGAIRNHIPELMYKLFEVAGYSKQDVDIKFSGMINALSYGAPPHGGIAPGIDRIVMLLCDEKNIREVTMFPMNQNAQDLMMNAPSKVNDEQLNELNLLIKKKS